MVPQESGDCLAVLRYSCKNPSLQSETVHYKRGVSQQFSLPSFKIDFSEWKDDEVTPGEPLLSLVSFLGSLSSGWEWLGLCFGSDMQRD